MDVDLRPSAFTALIATCPLVESPVPHRIELNYVEAGSSSSQISDKITDPQSARYIPMKFGADEPVIRLSDRRRSAGVPLGNELPMLGFQPEPIVNPSAQPLLTDRVRVTLKLLLELMRREARRNYIPVSKIEVSGFVDPEEDAEELVITQWVKVSTQAALNYWERLGTAVEVRTAALPDELARVASERIAIEVRWEH